MGVMHVAEWARIQGGKLFKTNSLNSTTKIKWNPESRLLIRVLSVYICFFNIHSCFMKSLCLSFSLVNDMNVMCFCKDWMLFSYGMFGIIMLYIEVILIELSPNIIFKVFFKFHMLLPNNPTFFFLFFLFLSRTKVVCNIWRFDPIY